MKFTAFILAAMLALATATTTPAAMAAEQQPIHDCGCVVFRYDDVQGTWNNELQIATLQLFIDKQVPATLAIVMEPYGNDPDVVEITKRGNRLGYFDLALHGWEHVDHTTLSRQEQEDSLYMALAKFEDMHGFTPEINVMPYNEYNNDTLLAMQSLGLSVISADMNHPSEYYEEYNITAIHDTVEYREGMEETTNAELMKRIKSQVKEYGYSMILLHPQEFRLGGQDNVLDTRELARLSELIDLIRAEGIPFSTIREMAFGTEPAHVISKHEVGIEDELTLEAQQETETPTQTATETPPKPETKPVSPFQQIVLWFNGLYNALFGGG
ncbi:MAG TPA: polysaccharide deacetylase family protein [Nitrososphaera sp.]